MKLNVTWNYYMKHQNRGLYMNKLKTIFAFAILSFGVMAGDLIIKDSSGQTHASIERDDNLIKITVAGKQLLTSNTRA